MSSFTCDVKFHLRCQVSLAMSSFTCNVKFHLRCQVSLAMSSFTCNVKFHLTSASCIRNRGDAFILPCTISNNGLGIKTSSLIDTGANGYTFVNTQFAKIVERFLGIKPSILKDPCKVRGFNGQQTTPITQFLELMLMIDR